MQPWVDLLNPTPLLQAVPLATPIVVLGGGHGRMDTILMAGLQGGQRKIMPMTFGASAEDYNKSLIMR